MCYRFLTHMQTHVNQIKMHGLKYPKTHKYLLSTFPVAQIVRHIKYAQVENHRN